MPNDDLVRIYALSDPESHEIRYVGKTVKNIKVRFSEHISKSLKNPTSYKDYWIKSLDEKGLRPLITLIETCEKDIWEIREKYWISHYRSFSRLTNISDGGDDYVRYGLENGRAKHTTDEVRQAVTLYVLGCNYSQIKSLDPFKNLKFRCLRGWTEKENRTKETIGLPTRKEYLEGDW